MSSDTKIHDLPADIFTGQVDPDARLIFHDYAALTGTFKGKSILRKNAISMVIAGEKTMHFAEKTLIVRPDEYHFLSSGNCLASMQLSDRSAFRSILIFFDNDVLTDFYLKYDGLFKQVRKNGNTSASEPYISFKKDPFVYNYITSLDLLLHSAAPMPSEMKQLKFDELLLHIAHTAPQKLLSFQYAKTRETNDLEIRKAVENNITNNITVDELAFLCNISTSTFKRRFTKLYGTSPTRWMMQQRMIIAKDLLLHYNAKPADVYHRVGYENHSSFSQAFKQTYGVSPKNFQSPLLTAQR